MGESGMKTVEDVGSPLKYEFQVRGLWDPGPETSGKGSGQFFLSGMSGCEGGVGEMEVVS